MNINFNAVKNFFRAAGRLFWQKIFLFFILFLFLDFLFAGTLLVEYYFKGPLDNQANNSLTLLNQGLLDKILSRWEAGRVIIKKLPAKEYPDFFQDFSTSSPVLMSAPLQEASVAATSSE